MADVLVYFDLISGSRFPLFLSSQTTGFTLGQSGDLSPHLNKGNLTMYKHFLGRAQFNQGVCIAFFGWISHKKIPNDFLSWLPPYSKIINLSLKSAGIFIFLELFNNGKAWYFLKTVIKISISKRFLARHFILTLHFTDPHLEYP